jgi:hypothetical protein
VRAIKKGIVMRIAGLVALGSMVVLADWAPAHAQVCTGNSDCASPLTCKAGASRCSQSGAMLPDGGISVSDPVCDPAPSKCTWSFVPCQAEGECALAQWTCLPIPGQTVIKTCFPKEIACSAGQTCPTGWSCLDLSQWEDGDEPLDIWKASNGTQFCWPDGLTGVLDGSAGTDASGLGLKSAGTSGGAASSDSTGSADSKSASKGSGCAMGGGHGPSDPFVMILALLGLLSLRRAARRR